MRPLTADEQPTVQAGWRASHALLWRRGPILLARARGHTARVLAEGLGCADPTVRQAMQAVNPQGLAALTPRSAAPQRPPPAACDPTRRAPGRAGRPQSPRLVGPPTSLWTVPLAAELAAAAGIPPRPVRGDTIRRALARLGLRWQRATPGSTSPDPASTRTNTRGPV